MEKVKRRKSDKAGLIVILVAAIFIVACLRPTVNDVAYPGAAMRQVTDDLGRTVTMPVKITRVVSLAPNLTENIFAVGAGDRLVGVTTFCNYPEAAKSITKIGDTMNPNMESIVALKPDVVFVSTASQIEAFMRTLEVNGIAVYVTNPTSFTAIFEELDHLAVLFGNEVEARLVTEKLQHRRISIGSKVGTYLAEDASQEAYDRRVGVVRVFVQVSNEPLFTIGNSTFLNEVIVEAGGRSVTTHIETAFPKLSKETALVLNPEVIILSDSEDNKEPNDVFKNSPAVKNGRVYKIGADILSRPGPRLVDALEQIAKNLHPEKFRNNGYVIADN